MKFLFIFSIISLLAFDIASQPSHFLVPYRVGNKWGYAKDYNKEVVIKVKFDSVSFFNGNTAIVQKRKKFAIIDNKGELRTKFKYKKLTYSGGGNFIVGSHKEMNCIDQYGKKMRCMFGCGSGGGNNSEYFKPYKKGNKTGVIIRINTGKKNGNRPIWEFDTIPPLWDEIKENYSGYAAVRNGNKWAIIGRDGLLISDYIYDKISLPSDAKYARPNRFKVKLGNKYGFLSEQGESLIEPIYHDVDFFLGKYVKVWLDDSFWGFIDVTNGTEYFKRE